MVAISCRLRRKINGGANTTLRYDLVLYLLIEKMGYFHLGFCKDSIFIYSIG